MKFKVFDIGGRAGVEPVIHDRVLTVANAITLARLAGLPVFTWVVLGPGHLGLAFWLLVVVAATDWVDGYVARRFDQVTRLGRAMDPMIDRLLVVTVAATLLVAGIMPWPLAALVVARDAALLVLALGLLGRVPTVSVTRTGKFGTACLMVGLPTFLLGAADWGGAEAAAVLAWGFTLVGVLAYYVAGTQYARLFLRLRQERAAA